MRKRGRVSSAALGVVPVGVDARTRPEPPKSLTPKEARAWREIVASLRADWFEPETLPLLTDYVRFAALSDRLSQELRDIPVSDPRFASLLRQKLQASNWVVRLATKLRLTIQSSTTTRTDKHAGPRPLPWPVSPVPKPFDGWS
jgi:hypothetical protein